MARKSITLLGNPIINEESAAGEAITPGHLVALTSTGTVIKNTANAANVVPAFALEREELGTGVDDAYASGDRVKVGVYGPGSRVYAWIPSGQNVTEADYLTTDNAGRLTKTGVTTALRISQALETVDNSTGPGDARIRVVIR